MMLGQQHTWLQWRQRAFLTTPTFWWVTYAFPWRRRSTAWSSGRMEFLRIPPPLLGESWGRAFRWSSRTAAPEKGRAAALAGRSWPGPTLEGESKKAELLSWFSQFGLIARFLISWKMVSFQSCLKTTFVLSREHCLVHTYTRLLVDPPWLGYFSRAGGVVLPWLPLQDEYGIRDNLCRTTQTAPFRSTSHPSLKGLHGSSAPEWET